MRAWSSERIESLLAEDVPHGDLTTHLLGIGDRPGRMRFQMRRPGVVCGIEVAAQLVTQAGGAAQVVRPTGTRVAAGDLLLEASGTAGALHQAWKVAQTLVEYLSGIATATAAMVDAARAVSPDIAVVTTRKTFPGNKAAMIEAIRAGGAEPHRLGLSETVLVFPEHRAFLADPLAAIARLRAAAPEKRIVVEVDTLEGVRAILPAGPDILQCEKMTPAEIAAVVADVAAAGSPARVAAAGGVNAGNAADYARAGAHILVSSAPYWAAPADVKVTLEAA
ncbi:ModD protein [Azorhizobium oxalatiphilum]|uniref:Putative pyrophosphorylase ModD n=1 Tax=Azorhizobium oxalatiphilum TaxID=980631 RepID=A0A917CFW0_9HYPH|nr:ModD protein [Azorhizobium oxalatiphilum]GGF85481.1 ModD protein [Azorhizobium oxalatiphilum]